MFRKKYFIYLIIFLVLFITSIFFIVNKENDFSITEEELNDNTNDIIENKTTKKDEKNIVVHITGQIQKEGVYELKEGSRIIDIVNLAGGMKEEADTNKINLACKLEDGMKIHIPKFGEDYNEINSNNSINKKININTASKEELETISGIGSSIAINIINYRNKNGKFKKIEDLKNVTGIGDNKFNIIKDNITI